VNRIFLISPSPTRGKGGQMTSQKNLLLLGSPPLAILSERQRDRGTTPIPAYAIISLSTDSNSNLQLMVEFQVLALLFSFPPLTWFLPPLLPQSFSPRGSHHLFSCGG